MPKAFIAAALALLLSQGAIGCAKTATSTNNPSPSATTASNPQTDRSPQAEVRKVVALTPLTADLIYQLAPEKLVGVPGSKLIAKDPRFKEIAAVSGEQTPPNVEKIVALKPDFVVGAEGFHDKALQKFQELGIKTLTTRVGSWQALEELTQNLAQTLNADPQPLLKRYQSFKKDTPKTEKSAIILVSRQPILAPNQESWAGDFLTQFQLKNAISQLQGNSPLRGYVTLSPEKILEVNPDIVLVADNETGLLEQFKADPFWNQLQAVKNGRIYLFDYYGIINPGSIDSVEKASIQLKKVLSETTKAAR